MVQYNNRSLERSLSIVACLRQSELPLALATIAEQVELNKATTFRLLSVLSKSGYVQKDASLSRYTLGELLVAPASGRRFQKHVSRTARPILRRLALEGNNVAFLSMRNGPLVYNCEYAVPPGHSRRVAGKTYTDAHVSGAGKVLLAHSSPREIAALYAGTRGGASSAWEVQSPKALCRELRSTYDNGFAVDDDESDAGDRSVAAPVFYGSNRALIAVGVSGLRRSAGDAHASECISKVKSSAAEISAALHSSFSGRRIA